MHLHSSLRVFPLQQTAELEARHQFVWLSVAYHILRRFDRALLVITVDLACLVFSKGFDVVEAQYILRRQYF